MFIAHSEYLTKNDLSPNSPIHPTNPNNPPHPHHHATTTKHPTKSACGLRLRARISNCFCWNMGCHCVSNHRPLASATSASWAVGIENPCFFFRDIQNPRYPKIPPKKMSFDVFFVCLRSPKISSEEVFGCVWMVLFRYGSLVGRDHLHGWGQKKSAKMALDVDGPIWKRDRFLFQPF